MTQVGSEALMFRVSEALAKDVGRGIARIDPKDMVEVGAEVGDIIQIMGKRPAVAKAMPAYMEDRGKDIIQLDGITRGNAQSGLGEKAQVGHDQFLSLVIFFLHRRILPFF